MSKARKILKRTLVGSSLIAAVGLLLWWNSTDATGRPVFWMSAIVLLATLFEVSRMGRLAPMDLTVPLLGAGSTCIAVAFLGFQHGAFDQFTQTDMAAGLLNRAIDWIEDGTVPEEQLCNIRYLDFVESPIGAVEEIYRHFDIELTPERRAEMERYIVACYAAEDEAHCRAHRDSGLRSGGAPAVPRRQGL